jgi:hypothetical protein
MTAVAPAEAACSAGSLVRARGRDWVLLPGSTADLLLLRPLGGGDDDIAGVLPELEPVETATFAAPDPSDLGDAASAKLLPRNPASRRVHENCACTQGSASLDAALTSTTVTPPSRSTSSTSGTCRRIRPPSAPTI